MRNQSGRRILFTQMRKTWYLGLPLVTAQLAQMSMGFVDTIMAGNLSAKALAAIAVGFSIFVPMLVFMVGTIQLLNAIVAHLYGAQEEKKIPEKAWQGIWLSFFLGIVCFFLLRRATFLLHLMNIQPEIIPIAEDYMRALSWGATGYFIFFAFRFVNEGLSVTKPSMVVALIGTVLNIVANYILMYGKFGAPALGAAGCGWASTIVWWIMCALMAFYSIRVMHTRNLGLTKGFGLPKWSEFREILGLGLPNGVNMGIEVSMFATAALLIGSMGVDNVAGHQIAINIASLTFMIPLGLSHATTARVGFAMGAKNYDEAKLAGYAGIGLALIVMCLTALIMLALPQQIVSIYTRETDVQTIAVRLLLFAALFQISDGLQVAGLGALRGMKDTRFPMIVNVTAYWVVGMPLGYYLGIVAGLGADGIWIGLIAGLTVAAVLHNIRFRLKIKAFQYS